MPREVKTNIATWKRMCPDYEIIEWNESNFNVLDHPFCSAAYKAGAWAFASDYARLKIVYEHGGTYLDTDIELLKNLDFLLDHSFWIGVGQQNRLCTTGLGFGAEAKNEVVDQMLEMYNNLEFDNERRSEIACPWLNHRVVESMGYTNSDEIESIGRAVIYPRRYFDPIAPGRDKLNLLCDETVSIHHYANSWGTPLSVMKRRLIQFVGLERVDRIKRMLG